MSAQGTAPTISVIIPCRRGYDTVAPVLDRLAEQIQAVQGEVVVVDGTSSTPEVPGWVRWIPVDESDWMRLTDVGLREARGDVIAIGEDHTFPRADWCAAILRAHAEHPDVDLVAGCLVNAADDTLSGRANFLLLGPPYVPPLSTIPTDRPPPSSAMSVKRRLVETLDGPGSLETDVAPRLFVEGRMAVDDRIVAEHEQDLGVLRTFQFRFSIYRATYGYARSKDRKRRREVIKYLLLHRPKMFLRLARPAAGRGVRGKVDLVTATLFTLSASIGGVFGTLFGPGRAPAHFY